MKHFINRVPAKKWFITWIVIDALAFINIFIIYGPIPLFRDFWITTAMTTYTHQYLASVFYNDDTISKVIADNYIIENGQNTDTSAITFITNNSGVYSSQYDKAILEHDASSDYKVINISGSGYVGWLIAIYDPSKVSLATASKMGTIGETVSTIGAKNNSHVAINASGFNDPNWMGNGGNPTGVVIQNSKIIYSGDSTGYSGGLIGFNKNNVLVLTKDTPENAIKNGMRDAVTFGPFLIVNGEAAFIKGNGGWGIAPRTAIAQRKDGIVLFLIIDGRQPGYSIGADMVEVTRVLQNYGAYNAANLDGGASTSMAINGKLYNKPCASSASGERYIPDAWIVK